MGEVDRAGGRRGERAAPAPSGRGDPRARAAAARDEPVLPQPIQRRADQRPADAERVGQLALGGQPGAERELTVQHLQFDGRGQIGRTLPGTLPPRAQHDGQSRTGDASTQWDYGFHQANILELAMVYKATSDG